MTSRRPGRRLIMQYHGWRIGERFQWETTGQVRVCPIGTDAYSSSLVVGAVTNIVAEFDLPLEVGAATSPAQQKIGSLLAESSADGVIDCRRSFNNLNESRTRNTDLQAAMIIMVDGAQYCLYNPKSNIAGDEPPEWGWTENDGAILLR